MPTYEYVCEKCGKTFEKFQSMNDPRLTECIFEGCGGAVRRKIGRGAGIIFKGGGFYETDYRSDSYKQAAKSESSGGGKGDSSGGGSDSGASKPSGSEGGGSASSASVKSTAGSGSAPPPSSSKSGSSD